MRTTVRAGAAMVIVVAAGQETGTVATSPIVTGGPVNGRRPTGRVATGRVATGQRKPTGGGGRPMMPKHRNHPAPMRRAPRNHGQNGQTGRQEMRVRRGAIRMTVRRPRGSPIICQGFWPGLCGAAELPATCGI
jgi:hypothetical protein